WPRDWSSDVCSSDLNTAAICLRNVLFIFVSERDLLRHAEAANVFLCLGLYPETAHPGSRKRPRVIRSCCITSLVLPVSSPGALRSEERRVGKEGRFR